MGETAYYLRVSTDRQDDERQVNELRNHLGEEAFQAAREYADVGSGFKDDRQDFRRLWNDIEAGEIDRLVVYEVSRLSRRLSTAASFIDDCVEHEVGMETLADPFPTLKGDGDRMDALIGQLVTWVLQFEGELIRARVQSGVDNAIRQGKWVGRPPFGFETDDDGYLQVKPEDFVAMQTAIQTAEENPRQSVNSIARACGVPQSTLDRVLKDEDRAALYLAPGQADDRVESAVEEANIDASNPG